MISMQILTKVIVRRFLVILTVNLFSLPGCGPDKGGEGILAAGAVDQYVLDQRQTILDLTNETRAGAGVGGLVIDAALNEVAQAHARDMADRDFFDHTNPDGLSPFDRMRNAGISYSYAGENIAWYPSAESAVTGWINSTGHYANMTNGNFGKIGIGVYKANPNSYGNYYYVQLFTN